MRGKGKKSSAVKFDLMALENLYLMKQQLMNHQYKISPYTEFIVSEPKRRVVKSGSFRDKVLQHCLCDYVLLPKMENIFIKDNYAGQIGKGTLFGLDRLSENISEFYEENGYDGYILKCDITKFFYSIDHEILRNIVHYYINDKEVQYVCDLFIDSTDGVGLPLGNQISQVFALMFLNGLDHFITGELGCKFYGRYMDDFYLIAKDKEYLQFCLNAIQEYLSTLHLTLNDKTEIVPLKKGIRFLGFHTYITEEGKVIRKLTGDNKRQIKKRLRKYVKLIAKGELSVKDFYEKYGSWKAHASHGNCIKLIHSMDCFVEELFEQYGLEEAMEKKDDIRIIVAGSRSFTDYELLSKHLMENENNFENMTIISGTANGADKLGERFAEEHNINLVKMPANWNTFGKRAGYLRNADMASYASKGNGILYAFWDGKSKGTLHMIKLAKERGLETKVILYKENENG
jgi:hypothetical protein